MPSLSCLPFEILSKIFINCLHSDLLQNPWPNVNIAPLLLCRICHLWKGVAMTIPQLWVDLQIRLPTMSQSPNSIIIYFTWRAGSLCQTVPAFIVHHQVPNPVQTRNPWKFYQFRGFLWVPANSVFTIFRVGTLQKRLSCDMRLVDSLSKSGISNDGWDSFKFQPSPLLRRLHLDCRFGESTQNISRTFPLVQLTLCIEWDINDAKLLELLEQSPNLQCGIFKLALSTKARGLMVCRPHLKASFFPWCSPFDSLYLTSTCPVLTLRRKSWIKSTPAFTELHIQSCVKVTDYADSSNQIWKSLSSYVPNLKVLVIEKINNILSFRQIIPFLQLREGWPSAFRIRLEIILISLRYFFISAAAFRAITDHVNNLWMRSMMINCLRCCDRKTRRIGNGETRRLEICAIDGRILWLVLKTHSHLVRLSSLSQS